MVDTDFKDKAITEFPLVAKINRASAKIVTDYGIDKIFLNGEIIFLLNRDNRKTNIKVKRINLLGSEAKCKDGRSGLLSLSLIRKSAQIDYSEDSKIHLDFEMKMHYPLITRNKVYHRPEAKDPEFFNPYVDIVKGELFAEFGESFDDILDYMIKKNSTAKITSMDCSIKLLTTAYPWILELESNFTDIEVANLISHNWINIQPIFIRADSDDKNPTGWAFDEMMQAAKCIWRKCCVYFNIYDPIYLNNFNYKVLKNRDQVISLKDEVDIDDAVEIFVVSRFDPIKWGGGATFDSGTANAKIVTCDDQLSVTSASGEVLGAININHLAHELGHVLCLTHPGSGNPKSLIDGTLNTVMNVSGFYADNPPHQSRDNCEHIDNALFYSKKIQNNRKCVLSPEL